METKNKYSFNDWWEGKAVFNIPYKLGKRKKYPIFVTWSDFEEAEIPKIKEKQEEIFYQKVTLKYEELKTQFIQKYKNSGLKKQLLKIEIKGVKKMLFEKIENQEIIHIGKEEKICFEHTEATFTIHEIEDIQFYLDKSFVKGNIDFDNIQSPNCIYHSEIDFEAYSHSLGKYYNWLLMASKKIDNKQNTTKSEKTSEQNEVPSNIYPKIFKNGYAYQFFQELKNLIVLPETELADYAFIFHNMKDKQLQFINKNVKHTEFIDFLNQEINTDIKAKKFSFKSQKKNKHIFENLLKKYQPLIESLP